MTCNISNRFESCTEGFCCATDDFQFHIIYCKKIGYEGDHCSTRPSSLDCPCHDGFFCKPNIAGHLNSLYGTCHRDKAINNTTAATTTTHHPNVPFNLRNGTDTTSSDITTGGIAFSISTQEQTSEPSTQYGHGETTGNTSRNTQSPIVGETFYYSIEYTFSMFSEPACNMTDRFNNICPPGFCCCQNDFLQDGIYCRRLGLQNDTCSMNSDDTSYCPCSTPFICQPNLMTATFVSTYGKCTKPERTPTVVG
ncbi:hypothetical protein CHS0354_007867 [Potamilus streckersoni]|uniref:Uncharacterized protein n=1 Tax=Potamilus streckersoni TaxID=2493646 RepID=A0AAE0SYF5_9BIVA|nr:hypothetical protein CHS0354_007867 [Potamilus streckersoni]